MTPLILQGDVRETLKSLPDNSVHCVVTSPPYWALRSYLPKDHPLKPLEIGSEPTPEAFIATMVEVFREVRRVLHPSGTLWLNIGDGYAHDNPSGPQGKNGDRASRTFTAGGAGGKEHGLKPKDLCLIPERLALALQADGWWVRSRIAWCKRSPMPESVTDRPTSAWEHIWLLTKSARYFYDAEAVRQPAEYGRREWSNTNGNMASKRCERGKASVTGANPETGANLRNFWLLGPSPFPGAHFATFVPEIPRRAILAGTSARGCCPKCLAPWERVVEGTPIPDEVRKQFEAARNATKHEHGREDGFTTCKPNFKREFRTTGWRPTCECAESDPHPEDFDPIPCTVLDPFGGSGTTAQVAIELGRRAILCELNPDYVKLMETRTNVTPGLPLA